MKKLVFSLFIVIITSLCSCSFTKEKSINDFRGQAIAYKAHMEDGAVKHYLFFKNKGELEAVGVSFAEYEYYNIGDTINW